MFTPTWGNDPIFQMGWNHQPESDSAFGGFCSAKQAPETIHDVFFVGWTKFFGLGVKESNQSRPAN